MRSQLIAAAGALLGILALEGSASAQARILVYGRGVTTTVSGVADPRTHFPAGSTNVVATEAMWRAMTADDFRGFDGIWVDADVCSTTGRTLQAFFETRATWGAAVTGRIVLLSADPMLHAPSGGAAGAGAQAVMRNSAAWITGLGRSSTGGSTGLYVNYGCSLFGASEVRPATMTDVFGTPLTDSNFNAEIGALTAAGAAHPVLSGIAAAGGAANLTWSNFCHGAFGSLPAGWNALTTCAGQPAGTSGALVVRDVVNCAAPTTTAAVSVNEGASVTLTASTAISGGTIEWDLDNNGSFETAGASVPFSAVGRDGPSTVPVRVRARGASCAATTGVAVTVSVLNVAPTFTSTAPTTATVTVAYTYTAVTTDPANALDPRTYTLVAGPTGLTVSAAGVVSWTPTNAQVGMHTVTIRANDGDGGTTDQTWVITVRCIDADSDGATSAACGGTDCNDGNPAIRPGATEICNAIDDNCNAMTDEGFSVGTACMNGVGACATSGVIACVAGGTAACNAVAGTPVTERCDGIDNNCDGTVDENFSIGMACVNGTGVCQATGTRICATDGASSVCNAVPTAPGTESCNGLDDDCDGAVDNGGAALCSANPVGTACISEAPMGFCGCTMDSDCGTNNGRICDGSTRRCIDGCSVAPGRNGCPTGQFCTSNDPLVTGVCTTTCNFNSDCASTPTRPICLIAGDGGADAGVGNICVECAIDSQCAGRSDNRDLCIGAGNTCAQCAVGRTERCTASGVGSACLGTGLCGCSSDSDCSSERQCDIAMNRCEPRPAPDAGPDATPDATLSDIATDTRPADAGPDGSTGVISGDGACGCRTAGSSSGSNGTLGLLALGAAAALLRTRRRR